jgi:hypothetical protein
MTKYEVEIDYGETKERVERHQYATPILIRYFEDGILLAEIRSKRGVPQ